MWFNCATKLTILAALNFGYGQREHGRIHHDWYSLGPTGRQEARGVDSTPPRNYQYYGRPASPCAYDKVAKDFLGSCECPNGQIPFVQSGDVGLMVCAPVSHNGNCPDAYPLDFFTPPKYHAELHSCLLDCSMFMPCLQPGSKCYHYHNGTDNGQACMYEI